MKLALKVGGSVFCPAEKQDMDFAKKLSDTAIRLSENNEIIIVIGGGRLARKMIAEKKEAEPGTPDYDLHLLGIEASRRNASIMIEELGERACSEIPKNSGDVKRLFGKGKIVVSGGFMPGPTTDSVTLECAETVGADLAVIGTDVRGVYDRDPKKHADAKMIREIRASDLYSMVKSSTEPGTKTVVDPEAVKRIERTGIRTLVLDIRDMENLRNAIKGSDFEGTEII